eukprot:7206413-Lingulodinium_polyedra.AAC.1
MTSIFGSDASAQSAPPTPGKDIDKECKWCGRSIHECAWTRGGKGLECRICAAWTKYHLTNKEEKQKYLHECETKLEKKDEHRAKIVDFETTGRHPKRARVSTEETSEVAGETFLGNFWPKKMYEEHTGKK